MEPVESAALLEFMLASGRQTRDAMGSAASLVPRVFPAADPRQQDEILDGPIKTRRVRAAHPRRRKPRTDAWTRSTPPLYPMILIANEVMQEGLDCTSTAGASCTTTSSGTRRRSSSGIGRIDRLGSLTADSARKGPT